MPKFRSPVLGFNHNIRHNGVLFHVQTEDSGVQNPHLYTHLFHEGVIIASKKLEYDPEADNDIVKSLMQSQHKSVMRELKNGAFDEKIKIYLPNLKSYPTKAPGVDEVVALDAASAPVPVVDLISAAHSTSPLLTAEVEPAGVETAASVTPTVAMAAMPDPDAVAEASPPALVVHDKDDITPLPPAVPLDAIADGESAGSTLPIGSRHLFGDQVTDEAGDEAGASSPYAQLVVAEEKAPTTASGVLDSDDGDGDDNDSQEDAEINGLLSRLKEDSVDQPLPEGDTDRAGTWIVSRPGQKERPFEKTGPVAVPLPIQREEAGRRLVRPSQHLPEVTPPPIPPAANRPRKNTMPQIPASGVPAVPRRPTPPPTQVNPLSKPPSGQYSTVRPAPVSRPTSPVSGVTPPVPPSSTGTNPPVGAPHKPPTIPPARPATPLPVVPGAAPITRPPRTPPSVAATPVRPPPIPGRSQAISPVPPRGASLPAGRPPVGPAPPSRALTPVRPSTMVSPTGGPMRTVPGSPRPGARPTPVQGIPVQGGRPRPAPSEGVVVARPAVVIGAPPTVIGGPPSSGAASGEGTGGSRRIHGREPTPPPVQPESIFGHDLISEKSLDEVIMAYLSEDSTED